MIPRPYFLHSPEMPKACLNRRELAILRSAKYARYEWLGASRASRIFKVRGPVHPQMITACCLDREGIRDGIWLHHRWRRPLRRICSTKAAGICCVQNPICGSKFWCARDTEPNTSHGVLYQPRVFTIALNGSSDILLPSPSSLLGSEFQGPFPGHTPFCEACTSLQQMSP